MNFIRNFMLVLGPISSVFDFLTFYVMLAVLQRARTLFQTGWFVESLCTQVLVIFIIRTRNPLKSRPHPVAHRLFTDGGGGGGVIAIYARARVFRLRATAVLSSSPSSPSF